LLAIDGKKERHTDGRPTKTTEKQYKLDKWALPERSIHMTTHCLKQKEDPARFVL
jgi:hypothetical protein